MTVPYGPSDEMFTFSAFLVFNNRCVVVCVALGFFPFFFFFFWTFFLIYSSFFVSHLVNFWRIHCQCCSFEKVFLHFFLQHPRYFLSVRVPPIHFFPNPNFGEVRENDPCYGHQVLLPLSLSPLKKKKKKSLLLCNSSPLPKWGSWVEEISSKRLHLCHLYCCWLQFVFDGW